MKFAKRDSHARRDRERAGLLAAALVIAACCVMGYALVETDTVDESDAVMDSRFITSTKLTTNEVRGGVALVVPAGYTVTLSLNGHYMQATGVAAMLEVYGTLIIKDLAGGGYIQGGYPESGGAIWVADGGKVVLNNVEIRGGKTSLGGAIYVSSGGTVVMNGGTITGGSADYGGCVYVAQGGTFTMNYGTITGGTAVYGGCVYSEGTFDMLSGTVSNGSAQYGGGLAVAGSGSITISGGTVTGNTATQYGGGAASVSGTLTINGGTISGNTSSAYGGGVGVGSIGHAVFNSGTITGNTSTSYGGGVSVQGTFDMNGGTISSNTSKSGGGLSIMSIKGATNATANVKGGQFIGNSATYGGGIYISKDLNVTRDRDTNIGHLYMTGGTVSGNSAEYGGGFYNYRNDAGYEVDYVATISGVTVSGNKASASGGGIYGDGYTLTDLTVTGNSARYGGGLDVSAASISSCTVTQNTATSSGGGMYLSDRGSTSISDTTVSGNTSYYGGGLYVTGDLEVSGSSIENNTATGYGGGIHSNARYGYVYLRSGTVSNNTAGIDGGGIYTYHSLGLYIYGGVEVKGNHAGGTGGAMFLQVGCRTHILGGEFVGNTAGDEKTAGVYLSTSGKILYISGTPQIYGNGTAGDMSYGLHLTSGNYPHLDAAIKTGTMIQISSDSTPTASSPVKVFECDNLGIDFNLERFFFSNTAGTGFYTSEGVGYIGYNATAFPVEYHSNTDSDEWSLALISSTSGSVASCMFSNGGTRFLGWATSADGDVVYQPGNTYSDIGSRSSILRLYAVWDVGYYFLHFSANGGTGSAGPEIMYENRSYELPGSETFTREGYELLGWSLDPAAVSPTWAPGEDVSHLGQYASAGGEVTLYAIWTPVMVTVTWQDSDGTVLLEQEVAYGTVPTYVGKIPDHDTHVTDSTLTSWTTAVTSTELSWSPVVKEVTEDTVFTAVYTTEVQIHEVKVSVNDASMGSVSSITLDAPYGAVVSIIGGEVTITYGDESVTVSAEPADADGRYTYYLENWIVDGIELDEIDGYTVEENVELTAVFGRAGNSYVVTFDANGGEGTMAAQVLVYGEAEAISALAFTNDGYSFAGWALSADGDPVYADSQSVTEVGDATLYAVWARSAVSVTISAVNGTVDASSINAPVGSALSAAGSSILVNGILVTAAPAETGSDSTEYTFSHWEVGGEELSGYATVSSATDIVAVFSETAAKVTVIWVDHDGTVLLTEEIDYGADPEYTGTIPSRESTETIDYTFDGWAIDVSDNTGDIEMTAQYQESVREYVVVVGVYSEGWGDVPVYNLSVPYGADIGIDGTYLTVNGTVFMPSAYDDDDRYEYEFAGWDAVDGTTVTADMDIRAVYTATVKTYTVTWLNADGTVLLEQQVAYGEVPEYTGETPEYTASSDYDMVLTGWAPQVSAVDGDAEYVAAYSEAYTIEFDANGGVGSKSGITVAVTSSADLGSCAFFRLGYSFAGWSTEADGDAVIGDGATVISLASAGETVTLYAVWEEDSSSYWVLAAAIAGIAVVIAAVYALACTYRS